MSLSFFSPQTSVTMADVCSPVYADWFWFLRFHVVCRNYNSDFSQFMTYHLDCSRSDAKGANCVVGIAYASGAPGFPHCNLLGPVFDYMCSLCRSLFVLFVLFPVVVVFFTLQLTDTKYPLVSTNFSHDRYRYPLPWENHWPYINKLPKPHDVQKMKTYINTENTLLQTIYHSIY